MKISTETYVTVAMTRDEALRLIDALYELEGVADATQSLLFQKGAVNLQQRLDRLQEVWNFRANPEDAWRFRKLLNGDPVTTRE